MRPHRPFRVDVLGDHGAHHADVGHRVAGMGSWCEHRIPNRVVGDVVPSGHHCTDGAVTELLREVEPGGLYSRNAVEFSARADDRVLRLREDLIRPKCAFVDFKLLQLDRVLLNGIHSSRLHSPPPSIACHPRSEGPMVRHGLLRDDRAARLLRVDDLGDPNIPRRRKQAAAVHLRQPRELREKL